MAQGVSRIWLVRHGPTHARRMFGWTDLPADLSDTAALARLASALPDAPIISSDLTRAVTTADAVTGKRTRLPHDPDLRELNFGRWENGDFDEVWERENAQARAFWDGDGTVAAPGGESWAGLSARVSAAIDRLSDHPDIIVVAHFGAILSQVQRATRETPRAVMARRIDPLSLTRLKRTGKEFALQEINRPP